ncbi:hypothetical protein NM208_g4213 [Fusarium decemcellulare]|uniref:Uncharacterized protein n=1 Tax=Fusarium decemcellulare TaxID=57161 RepID=A0ACC1SLI4_9HYPO|nr:hypothetical protein NM208_g4213 [Fusarium decemcellulare]
MVAPGETAGPKPIQVFDMVKDLVAHCEQKLTATLTPEEKHRQAVGVINGRLELLWQHVFHTQNPTERVQIQGAIQNCVGEVTRLEIGYQASRKDDEAAYENDVQDTVEDCFEKLHESIALMGLAFLERICQVSPHNSTSDGPELGCENGNSQTNASSWDHDTAQPTVDESLRKRTGDDCSSSDSKRQRLNEDETPKTTRKTIQFEQVFMGGKASTKQIIVEWPPGQNQWYIIRCEEHAYEFRDYPLIAAAAHIGGKKHGRKPRDHGTVIKLLGVEVLGCNKTLAEQNNLVARNAFKSRGKRAIANYNRPEVLPSQRSTTQIGTTIQVCQENVSASTPASKPTESNNHPVLQPEVTEQNSSSRSLTLKAATYLKPGQIYCVYDKDSNKWVAALLLPMKNLHDIGVPSSIKNLGLLRSLPLCYLYDSQSETFLWNEGYEDEGPRVTGRQYPVMFFDGSPFPEKAPAGWAHAEDLKIYNASSWGLTEHRQQVLDFLEVRGDATLQELISEVGMSEPLANDVGSPMIEQLQLVESSAVDEQDSDETQLDQTESVRNVDAVSTEEVFLPQQGGTVEETQSSWTLPNNPSVNQAGSAANEPPLLHEAVAVPFEEALDAVDSNSEPDYGTEFETAAYSPADLPADLQAESSQTTQQIGGCSARVDSNRTENVTGTYNETRPTMTGLVTYDACAILKPSRINWAPPADPVSSILRSEPVVPRSPATSTDQSIFTASSDWDQEAGNPTQIISHGPPVGRSVAPPITRDASQHGIPQSTGFQGRLPPIRTLESPDPIPPPGRLDNRQIDPPHAGSQAHSIGGQGLSIQDGLQANLLHTGWIPRAPSSVELHLVSYPGAPGPLLERV